MPSRNSTSLHNLDSRSEAQLSRIAEIVYQIQRLQRELINLTIQFRLANDSNFDPSSNEALEEDERMHQHYVDVLAEVRNFLGSDFDPHSVVTEDV